MGKKLTDNQKALNKLINLKARLVAEKSRLESRTLDVNLAIFAVEAQLGEMRNKVTQLAVLQLNEAEKAMCRTRDFIGAIKSLRARATGYLGLKEAKDIVDAYRDTLPNGGR